jgi:hypothetical protein
MATPTHFGGEGHRLASPPVALLTAPRWAAPRARRYLFGWTHATSACSSRSRPGALRGASKVRASARTRCRLCALAPARAGQCGDDAAERDDGVAVFFRWCAHELAARPRARAACSALSPFPPRSSAGRSHRSSNTRAGRASTTRARRLPTRGSRCAAAPTRAAPTRPLPRRAAPPQASCWPSCLIQPPPFNRRASQPSQLGSLAR